MFFKKAYIASAVCVGTTLAVGPHVPGPVLALGPAPRVPYLGPIVQQVGYATPGIQYAAPLNVASAVPAYSAIPARLPYPVPFGQAFPHSPAPPAVVAFNSAPLLKVAAAERVASVAEPVYPPQPYSFGYEHTDEYGTKQSRQESSDANNAKTGSYGFTDARGIFRQVNYVADADGFRASISTNEPGTAPSAPASAVYSAHGGQVAVAAPLVAKSATVVAPIVAAAPTIHAAPAKVI